MWLLNSLHSLQCAVLACRGMLDHTFLNEHSPTNEPKVPNVLSMMSVDGVGLMSTTVGVRHCDPVR